MAELTIWHNPRCSKSRAALALLEAEGKEIKVFRYLDEKPSADAIRTLLSQLGVSARTLMRAKETIYKELGLKEVSDEEKLIEAMATHPKLIERPIVVKGNKAVIGRPTEKIMELFG